MVEFNPGTVRPVDLTDKLIPWKDGEPVWLTITGSIDWYLPVFDSVDQLQISMADAGVEFDSIKRIEDGIEFFDSIPLYPMVAAGVQPGGSRIKIVINIRRTPEGMVRWSEMLR